MSDVIPAQNDVHSVEYTPPVTVVPDTGSNQQEPEEIENTEEDSGQNVDTFA